MELPFYKMHGLGNDFVLIDGIDQSIPLDPTRIRWLGDRHFGIGFDQLLLLEKSHLSKAHARYRIFNADGSEVGQCGNGSRCAAWYLKQVRNINQTEIILDTPSGLITTYFEANHQIRVNMGIPQFDPHNLPMDTPSRQPIYSLKVEDKTLNFHALSMGNPHAVLIVEDTAQTAVETIGKLLNNHPLFPAGVNVGFLQLKDSSHIRLRVYERGAGETLACGTGACAAMAAGYLFHNLANNVDVELPGGNLHIQWQGENTPLWMTGPATFVFKGVVIL